MSDNVRDDEAKGAEQPGPERALGDDTEGTAGAAGAEAASGSDDRVRELEQLVGERTADLQRLQAEYVNYKKRVDRDRDQARGAGVERVLVELLPVLDAVWLAESHGELTGGFKMVADELAKVTGRHGLEAYGEKGDEFDPRLHEALMHLHLPGVTVTTCSEIMQPGYKLNDRVLRPARVAVSDPDPDAVAAPAASADEAPAEEGGDHE
ncbi:MAG TPA: nucleotide exchange factor GrpE [Propionibacteriaceae bacterium]|nr:nucleotide exchange factor GrpE [Propionibacteriaceae bacterium]